jgi:hypothetical protein
MLNIDFDTSRITAKLDKMLEQVESFGHGAMPEELMAWQVEDIHRSFPRVDQPDEATAEMSIETHVQRANVQSSRTGRRPVFAVHRPVLRPMLIARLCERMSQRMRDEMKW